VAKKRKKGVSVRGDVSKKTVVILLIIAVVLSVISTWLVMGRTNVVYKKEIKQPESSATASINIIGPDDGSTGNKADGNVGITINKNTEE